VGPLIHVANPVDVWAGLFSTDLLWCSKHFWWCWSLEGCCLTQRWRTGTWFM